MKHLATLARIAGLWAIAVAHPLLDTLARGPEFLVAQRTTSFDVVMLVALLTAVPPLAATLAIELARLLRASFARVLEGVLSGALIAILAVQAAYHVGLDGWTATAGCAAAATVAAAAAWLRFDAFRTFVAVMSPAALIVPLLFLARPGVRPLVWPAAEHILEPAADTSTPVVLLVFDELPLVSLLDADGRLDAARYPHLAQLAAEGVWFRNAVTSSDYTRWALPALLSGRTPRAEATPLFDQHPRNLFTVLGASHRIEALEPITALCPPQLCAQEDASRRERLAGIVRDIAVLAAHIFYPPRERAALPPLTANWAGFGEIGDDLPDDDEDLPLWRRIWNRRIHENHAASALAFVDAIAPGDAQPTLYFMHTLASHHPLRWLPSGQAVDRPRRVPGLTDDVWTTDPWPVAQFQQGHLVQAGLVDTIVGRIRARLERAGVYDDALVIVTSDHGISFNPGDELRSVTDTNAGDIVSVPLIVKLPDDLASPRRGTVDDRLVESIDLLPTIADALDIDLPWPVDGISALGRERRSVARTWIDDARRQRQLTVRDLLEARRTALERRLARFTDGVWPAPRTGPLDALLGRPVDALDIGGLRRGLVVHIDRPYAMTRVRLKGPALPVQLAGRVDPPERASRAALPLVIALNGTVAAVTQTWSGQAGWMALLPPAALREGDNTIEVLLADDGDPDRLMRLARAAPDPRGVNLLFADHADLGVEQSGFFGRERSGRSAFRWTNGSASIALPLPRGVDPRELQIEIVSGGTDDRRLHVLADDCTLLEERIERGRTERTVPLASCPPLGDAVVLRFVSDTHQPRNDRRRLGIALSRVVLR